MKTLVLIFALIGIIAAGAPPKKDPVARAQEIINELLPLRNKLGYFDLREIFFPVIATCSRGALENRYFIAEFIKAENVSIVVHRAKKHPHSHFAYEGDLTIYGLNGNVSYFFNTDYNLETEKPLEWKFSRFELHKCHGQVKQRHLSLPVNPTTVTVNVTTPLPSVPGAKIEKLLDEFRKYKSIPNLVPLEDWLVKHMSVWHDYDCHPNMDKVGVSFNKIDIGDSLAMAKHVEFKVIRYDPAWVIYEKNRLMVDGFRNKTLYYRFDFADAVVDPITHIETEPWKIKSMTFDGCIV